MIHDIAPNDGVIFMTTVLLQEYTIESIASWEMEYHIIHTRNRAAREYFLSINQLCGQILLIHQVPALLRINNYITHVK